MSGVQWVGAGVLAIVVLWVGSALLWWWWLDRLKRRVYCCPACDWSSRHPEIYR